MKWQPVDIVVLIITVMVGVSFMFLHVKPLLSDTPLSENSATKLGQIYFAYIAIISMYIGVKSKISKRK